MNEHDNSNWIWGLFYFNREDKRLFPPKRIPLLGWTINFANPYSVLAFAGLIFAVVSLVHFLTSIF
ncbi:MAG: hypothetical protein KF900_12065 [Bacteroidetes bacterium]|nr:hypothetical protein [Bacteroidota bacterium]